jgi:ABC-2 type transport system ATP-binding protein
LLKPTAGTASVAGFDVATQQAEVRSVIGIVFQEPSLDERLTARENLEFHAVLFGVARAERRARVADALRLVDLADRGDDQVERFSGGMKRRLEIARGLLHTPEVLFLDEPTLGLDPQTRRNIWDRIGSLRAETGVTIFMTTHYMEEAEFCDRIAVIDHGRIVALGTPEELKRQVGGDVITVTTGVPDTLVGALHARGIEARIRGAEVLVEVDDGAAFIPRLTHEFDGAIERIQLRRPTLDDVFLHLTGRTIRESELGDDDVARNRFRSRMRMRGRGGH